MQLSVIIPTHFRLESLRRALQSLSRQNCDFDFEVLVVSNLPDSSALKLVNSFGSHFHFYCVGKVGVNRARNLGIANSYGEIILFLDDDCYLEQNDFLQRHVLYHRQNPLATGLGGPYQLKEPLNTSAMAYHWIADYWLVSSADKDLKTPHLLGGNLSLKRNLLGDFRFDNNITFGGSETELLERLYRSGKILKLIPSLAVGHDLKMNLKSLSHKAYMQGISSRTREKLSHPQFTLLNYLQLQNVRIGWLLQIHFEIFNQFFAYGRGQRGRPNLLSVIYLVVKKWTRGFFEDLWNACHFTATTWKKWH